MKRDTMNTYNQVNPITLKRRPEKNSKESAVVDSTLLISDNDSENSGTSLPELRAKLKRERAQALQNGIANEKTKTENGKEDTYTPDFDRLLNPLGGMIKQPLPASFYRFVDKEFKAAKVQRLTTKRIEGLYRDIRLLLKEAISKSLVFKNDWDQQLLTSVFREQPLLSPVEEKLDCLLTQEQKKVILDTIPYEKYGIEPPNVTRSTPLSNDTNLYEINDPTSIVTVEAPSAVPPPPPPISARPPPPWAQNVLQPNRTTTLKVPLPPVSSVPPPAIVPSFTKTVATSEPIGYNDSRNSNSMSKMQARMDENTRRMERLKRFANPDKSTNTRTKRVKIDDDDSYSDLNAITNKAYKFDKDKPIVGVCQVLEKRYLRLTSEPDPEKVRPLEVLRKALDWIVGKFRSGSCSYQYFCDQMKSIRQDLKVQMIENDFTVTVYKTHARAALENGDIGEYNQCQSSLKPLFDKDNIDKSDLPEFISYRIYYHMMTSDHSSVNQLRLQLLTNLKHISGHEMIKRALRMVDAQIQNNYHLFMRIYQQTKGPERHLVDQFIKKERVSALNYMCKAYARVPLQFLAPELHFNNANEAFTFLTELELIQFMVVPQNNPDDMYIDCKSCRPTIMKHFSDARRVDIKGQI